MRVRLWEVSIIERIIFRLNQGAINEPDQS